MRVWKASGKEPPFSSSILLQIARVVGRTCSSALMREDVPRSRTSVGELSPSSLGWDAVSCGACLRCVFSGSLCPKREQRRCVQKRRACW